MMDPRSSHHDPYAAPGDAQEGESAWRSPQSWFFSLAMLGALAHLFYYYPQLPERVATHFGPGGRADAWGSKQGFALTYGLVVGGLGLLFLSLAIFLPRLPAGIINIPNRGYWLAPEREQATLRRVARQMLTFGAATVVFLAVTFHVSMQASMTGTDQLGPGFWVALLAYLLYACVWALRFTLAFRKPER
jgi:uncharacterized membrane protein